MNENIKTLLLEVAHNYKDFLEFITKCSNNSEAVKAHNDLSYSIFKEMLDVRYNIKVVD